MSARNRIGASLITFIPELRASSPVRTRARAAPLLLLCALWSAPGHAPAQAADCPLRPVSEAGVSVTAQAWTRVSENGPVCVYTRKTSGSNLHDVMATAAIAAAPARVFDVISDYASYPQFMPYVESSEVLGKEAGAQWVFQQLAFPLISDRYYTIRLNADVGLAVQNIYRISWTLAQGSEPARKGRGEPTLVNNGSWDLRPLGAGSGTQAVYFIHTDPGGDLPGFIVNLANTAAVPSVIEAVRARAAGKLPQASTSGDAH
jgi:hypothetical protein